MDYIGAFLFVWFLFSIIVILVTIFAYSHDRWLCCVCHKESEKSLTWFDVDTDEVSNKRIIEQRCLKADKGICQGCLAGLKGLKY